MKLSYPLISCICITKSRPDFLKRAIKCFENQNYPNKEMVISYPEGDKLTKDLINHVLSQSDLNIIKIERSDEESVGNARNQAVAKCRGDFVCIWDDDDWYHASRLSFQYNSMQTTGNGYNASILTRLLLFDHTTNKAYLSFPYSWENSMLCRKEIIMQNQYAHRNKGEDTHIIQFLDSKKFLYHIDEAPFLYIYVYHGENTWDYEHFEYFINKSSLLDESTTESIKKLITIDN